MPKPIRPGIKKAVTPNIGITAFYIKSQHYRLYCSIVHGSVVGEDFSNIRILSMSSTSKQSIYSALLAIRCFSISRNL